MVSKFESAPQSDIPDNEPSEANIEAGRQTAELISEVYGDLPPRLRKNLVNSNIVLTLAGEKGLTYQPIEISCDEDAQVIREGTRHLQYYLEQRRPEVHVEAGSNVRQKRDGIQYVSLTVENLQGYEQVTRETRIPGVPKFNANDGYEKLAEWEESCLAGLEEAQAQGKIPQNVDPQIVYQGIASGYPDVAIIDFAQAIDSGKPNDLEEVPIEYAGTYKEAVPNYDVKSEHLSKPSVIKHRERWSNVLTGFYKSGWHQKVAPELRSHRWESSE